MPWTVRGGNVAHPAMDRTVSVVTKLLQARRIDDPREPTDRKRKRMASRTWPPRSISTGSSATSCNRTNTVKSRPAAAAPISSHHGTTPTATWRPKTRSEERRVGKESSGREGWGEYRGEKSCRKKNDRR